MLFVCLFVYLFIPFSHTCNTGYNYNLYITTQTSLVVWSECGQNHEVPGSIPGSTAGIFPEGEISCGDHGLGRLVEFRFKGRPGTTSSYITTHIIGTT